jgi:hypothetical protein
MLLTSQSSVIAVNVPELPRKEAMHARCVVKDAVAQFSGPRWTSDKECLARFRHSAQFLVLPKPTSAVRCTGSKYKASACRLKIID